MDELEFNKLIKRYQQNLLSADERAVVDDWLKTFSKEENDGSWTEKDKIMLREKILAAAMRDEEMRSSDRSGNSFNRVPFSLMWKIAAGLLLLSTLTYFLWQTYPVESTGGVAAAKVSISSGVQKVRLSDGSLVWLKGNSTLSYPETFPQGARNVTLKGEALFEVSPDASKPFIIQCGDLTTTVLGTSFNIKSSEENIEVVVLTGKVSLTSQKDPEGIIVLPREKAMYWKGNQRLAKVEKDIKKYETNEAVAGTEYSMYFEDTKMKEVARRIEEKFDVEIHAENEMLMNCVITADFTGQPLERTLNMIAQALGGEYEISDDSVTITGAGCN